MPLWTIAIPRRDPKLYVSAAAELLVYVKRQGGRQPAPPYILGDRIRFAGQHQAQLGFTLPGMPNERSNAAGTGDSHLLK